MCPVSISGMSERFLKFRSCCLNFINFHTSRYKACGLSGHHRCGIQPLIFFSIAVLLNPVSIAFSSPKVKGSRIIIVMLCGHFLPVSFHIVIVILTLLQVIFELILS